VLAGLLKNVQHDPAVPASPKDDDVHAVYLRHPAPTITERSSPQLLSASQAVVLWQSRPGASNPAMPKIATTRGDGYHAWLGRIAAAVRRKRRSKENQ
jgi:hypothetical protein